MIFATLAFTVMVALVKVTREEMAALELVCWRGATSIVLTFLLARRGGFAVRRPVLMLSRILCGFGAMTCFFTAAKGLSLADLSLLTKLQPILVALLAPLVLGAGERGGWALAVALVLGVSGTVLLLTPELAVGSTFAWWALAGTVLSAGAHLSVRALSANHRPETVVFWFQVGGSLLAALLLLGTTGRIPVPPAHLWPHVLGVGAAATVGQVMMTRAYASDPAPLVAAASYVGPIWALVGDLLLFGVAPDWSVLVGGALLLTAGAILLTAKSGAASGAYRSVDRV
jgi:drug/metabolite transporter (DMT)-like permease